MSCRHCRSRVVWNGKSPRWRATTESTGKIVSRLLTNGCIIEAEYNHHQPERGTLCTRKTNIDHAGRLLIPNISRLPSVRRVRLLANSFASFPYLLLNIVESCCNSFSYCSLKITYTGILAFRLGITIPK